MGYSESAEQSHIRQERERNCKHEWIYSSIPFMVFPVFLIHTKTVCTKCGKEKNE